MPSAAAAAAAAAAVAVGARRRALVEAFGESSDSEDEAHPCSDPDSDAEIESHSPNEAQRRALIEAFGESSDSEDRFIAEFTNVVYESSSDREYKGNHSSAIQIRGDDRCAPVEACRDSSDSEDEARASTIAKLGQSHSWQSVEGIEGLWLCRNFLSEKHQLSLIQAIQREGWFAEGSDNNQGICAHVDLMRFADGIAIVSLESACVMHFTRCEQEGDMTKVRGGEDSPETRIPVYLSPGSLVLLSGEARYRWKHEINRKPGFQLWEGKEIHQERRTSVTLRKLLQLPNES